MKVLLDAAMEDSEALLRGMLLAENYYSTTALHSAAQNGYEDVVKLLMSTANQSSHKLLEEILLKRATDTGHLARN